MKQIFIIAALLICISVRGQQVPAKKVEYFTKNGEKLPSLAGAYSWQETVYQDSIQSTTRSFYANGKPKASSEFENVGRSSNRGNGIGEAWYENGQLRMREKWLHGKRDGELTTYYKNGTLRRRETFVDGKSVSGECFDVDGKEVKFYEYEIMPVPPGGMDAMWRYLGTNTRYPNKALVKNIQGKVLVNFCVDSTGSISDIKIQQSVHPLLDDEAKRVIASFPAWQPGWQDGRPVKVSFTMPVTFAIKGKKAKPVSKTL